MPEEARRAANKAIEAICPQMIYRSVSGSISQPRRRQSPTHTNPPPPTVPCTNCNDSSLFIQRVEHFPLQPRRNLVRQVSWHILARKPNCPFPWATCSAVREHISDGPNLFSYFASCHRWRTFHEAGLPLHPLYAEGPAFFHPVGNQFGILFGSVGVMSCLAGTHELRSICFGALHLMVLGSTSKG